MVRYRWRTISAWGSWKIVRAMEPTSYWALPGTSVRRLEGKRVWQRCQPAPDLIPTDEGWLPDLSPEDAERPEAVREARHRRGVRAVRKEARVYRLTPVAA